MKNKLALAVLVGGEAIAAALLATGHPIEGLVALFGFLALALTMARRR